MKISLINSGSNELQGYTSAETCFMKATRESCVAFRWGAYWDLICWWQIETQVESVLACLEPHVKCGCGFVLEDGHQRHLTQLSIA